MQRPGAAGPRGCMCLVHRGQEHPGRKCLRCRQPAIPQQGCEGTLQHLGRGEAAPRGAGCQARGDAGPGGWGHRGCSPMDVDAWRGSPQGCGRSQGVAELCEHPPTPHSQPVPAAPVRKVTGLVNDSLSAGITRSHSHCSEALPPSAVGSVGAEVPGSWQPQLPAVPSESP